MTKGNGSMGCMKQIIISIAAKLVFLIALSLPAQANPEVWKESEWSETDFSRSLIDFRDVLSGGPPKDGIPSIDNPDFVPFDGAAEAFQVPLGPQEPVIALEIHGDARAYPLRVLTWHEIVNDEVGGVPVAVTYCPLCNSAVVFERREQGQVYEFGTTGKLLNSNLIMYDRQTESWWQQFTGVAIVGKKVGAELKLVPARLISLQEFGQMHPDGIVLIPTDPEARPYGRNPYEFYDHPEKLPFLYNGSLPENINPMARVVVVKTPDGPLAWALELVRKKKRIEAGGYVIEWRPGQNSALDTSEIKTGRGVGSVSVQLDGEDAPYDVALAFAFHAFHPEVPITTD